MLPQKMFREVSGLMGRAQFPQHPGSQEASFQRRTQRGVENSREGKTRPAPGGGMDWWRMEWPFSRVRKYFSEAEFSRKIHELPQK